MNGNTEPQASPKEVSLELILQAVHDVRDEVRVLAEDHATLKRQVNGSGAPPPNDGTPIVPLAKKIDDVSKELKKQSSAMGLAGVFEWFSSPGATAKALRIVGTVAAVYSALHVAGVIK